MLLNAAKAFDSVEWTYMFTILQKIGLPPLFINWIKLLYNQPTARIKVNRHVSEAIVIQKGMRQGCPLSGS